MERPGCTATVGMALTEVAAATEGAVETTMAVSLVRSDPNEAARIEARAAPGIPRVGGSMGRREAGEEAEGEASGEERRCPARRAPSTGVVETGADTGRVGDSTRGEANGTTRRQDEGWGEP